VSRLKDQTLPGREQLNFSRPGRVWIRIRDPDPESGSAIRKNAGSGPVSGSALNQCGSATLPQAISKFYKRRIFWNKSFPVHYSTLPPCRFHCVGGRWDRTQNRCDYGLTARRSIHSARTQYFPNSVIANNVHTILYTEAVPEATFLLS
jgi:hypothetical protein